MFPEGPYLDIGQVFIFAFFIDQDEVEVNKNLKRTRPIYSHLEQTSLVNKELIIWSFLGPTWEIMSRQDEPSLSPQLANQNVEFALSFPPADSTLL